MKRKLLSSFKDLDGFWVKDPRLGNRFVHFRDLFRSLSLGGHALKKKKGKEKKHKTSGPRSGITPRILQDLKKLCQENKSISFLDIAGKRFIVIELHPRGSGCKKLGRKITHNSHGFHQNVMNQD